MAHIGLFVSLCLAYNIYRSDDEAKEKINSGVTIGNDNDPGRNKQF